MAKKKDDKISKPINKQFVNTEGYRPPKKLPDGRILTYIKQGDRWFQRILPAPGLQKDAVVVREEDERVEDKEAPEWAKTEPNSFERMLLVAVGRDTGMFRWDEKKEANSVRDLVAELPREWLESVLKWLIRKRAGGRLVHIRGFITAAQNDRQYQRWLEERTKQDAERTSGKD